MDHLVVPERKLDSCYFNVESLLGDSSLCNTGNRLSGTTFYVHVLDRPGCVAENYTDHLI